MGLALVSNASGLGEHTINRQGTSEFSIERSLPDRFNAEEVTMAACIAQPDSWDIPSAVASTGNAQVESESSVLTTTAYSTAATRYTDGEAVITNLQALQDYTWYCYQDKQRHYAEDDSAGIVFSLSTDDTNTTVYSSIGFIEGVSVGPRSAGDFYYQSISSHQVLRDIQAADYYLNLSPLLSESDFVTENFAANTSSYEVVDIENTTYFLGYSGQSFSIDSDGTFKSYNTPNNARSYYINGQFIFLISEGNPQINDTEIQFGRDLNNLSIAYDIKEVGYAHSLTYDASTNQYVMLNPGTSSTAEKAYYTSTDLITWTANTVGLWQNWLVVFADDGRAVMKNLSLVDSLMSRSADGDWQAFEHYPSDQYFSTRDIIFAHDRFHVLVTEYSNDGSSTVLSSRIGYSDDLSSWNWTILTTNADDIASVPTLVELGANQIGIINNSDFRLSSDNGETWGNPLSPLSALKLDAEVDTSVLSVRIDSLTSINEALVGTARISTSNNEISDFIFSTLDGSQFNLIHRTEDPQLFNLNNDLYFYATNRAEWAIYKATEASLVPDPELPEEETKKELDEETEDLISAGSLFWFISIFATLGSIRTRKIRNKK